MKKYLLNRIAITIVAFVAGGTSVWGLTHYLGDQKVKDGTIASPQFLRHEPNQFFNDFFNEDFFGKSRDPFAEMIRMQKEMLKSFEDSHKFHNNFGNWSKNILSNAYQDIKKKEDTDFLYYEIDLREQKPKEVKVDVKDGQIFISGQFESQENENNSSHHYSSSFQKSFPAPMGVDNNFKMEQEGRKLVIKFPKIKS